MRRLALLVPLCLSVAACSSDTDVTPTDGGTPDAGEAADNCTDEMPCSLTSGARSMPELLAPVGDTDRWAFDVPAAGRVVNLLLENDADFSPVRLEVTLFGPDGTSVDAARFMGNGRQRVELQLVAPAAGRFVAEVRDVGSDAADRRNPYFITVTVLEETDTNEPNDTFDSPTPIAAGTPVTGTIGFQGDEDWFAIDVGANQLVQIELDAASTEPSPVRLAWTLFDATGVEPIARSVEPEGAAWPVENRAVGNASGTYLVRIEDDDGMQADLSRTYILTVRLVAEPDAQEQAAPNDTPATGSPVSSGQAVSGYVAATSDVDYYAIQVASVPQLITVEATMPAASDVDLQFTVLAPDGETLICDARDGDLCKAFRFIRDGRAGPGRLVTAHVAEEVGTYYVRVSDQQDNEFDTATAYTLTVTLPPEPDSGEDYLKDGRDGAVPVVLSSTNGAVLQFPWVEGYISHADDEDWFRFDVPGPEGTDPLHNGDWLVNIELQMPSPSPVELQAFFYGPRGSDRESYRGYGQRCRDPSPDDPMNCQYPDADNGIDVDLGEASGECFVIFREVTGVGPHYFRMTDLDRDDFDLGARYRLRVTVTAGCPMTSVCSGRFTDRQGNDLCGRP